MLIRSLVVDPFAENSMLVGCTDSGDAALVDPGGRVDELLESARSDGLTVREIWLTHAHIDHVAGVADAVDATGAAVLLHPDETPIYASVEQQGIMFGLQVRTPPPPDRWLTTGETLRLGSLRARVLSVPGHSPGHVAFWFESQGAVLSGDCLFAGSIGRTDLPGGSYATLMASIRDVLLPLGDATKVHPGHGPATTIGEERSSNPFLV